MAGPRPGDGPGRPRTSGPLARPPPGRPRKGRPARLRCYYARAGPAVLRRPPLFLPDRDPDPFPPHRLVVARDRHLPAVRRGLRRWRDPAAAVAFPLVDRP